MVPLIVTGAKFQALQEQSEKQIQALQERIRELKEQSQEQIQALKEQSEKQIQALQERIRELKERSQEQIQSLQERIRELREETERIAREAWFEDIAAGTPYRNEIEVEVKFILPLVKFLGYHERDLELRVPVELQMGSQSIKGEADWVLWDRETNPNNPSALVVIEAKAPTSMESLDKAQAQARSYAFGLNAPTYMITDGERLQIFRRGIRQDTRVVNCAVRDLAASWPAICQAMGAKARTTIIAELPISGIIRGQ